MSDPRIIPGEYYYGADCDLCGRFMWLILDDEHGVGPPATIRGGLVDAQCLFCNRDQRVWASSLRRKQAPLEHGSEEPRA